MDVRFDSNAAQKLIESMNDYCHEIEIDAVEVLKLTDSIPEWQDDQAKQFCQSIRLICKDLSKVLHLEGEYLNLYQKRVNELRG